MSTTQITASTIQARKLEEDKAWGQATNELINRATLPIAAYGLVTKIGTRTTTYISLGEFSRLVFLGEPHTQHKKGHDALLQLRERIYAENFKFEKKEVKSIQKAISAKYLIEARFEPFNLSVLDIGNFKRVLISAKACEMMMGRSNPVQTNPNGPEALLAYFSQAHANASRYFGAQEDSEDCVVSLSPDSHEMLGLREKPSYINTDPAYFVKECRDLKNEWHETYMTTIGLSQLIFRNRLQENCKIISEVLHRIEANLKSLGREGSKQWSCNTSLGTRQLHLISRNDFIHMCDRLKWEEQYRLPASDWDIREDGLDGFRATTIAWHEAQDAHKRKGEEARVKKEHETPAEQAPIPAVDDPFDFKFEEANEGSTQSEGEMPEKPIASSAPTAVVGAAPQSPAPPERTIYQKLEEIANRAKAKKRDIDEAMNLEMVALFSEEGRTRSEKAAKSATGQALPSTGAVFFDFS